MSDYSEAASAARRGYTAEELANNARTLNYRKPWMQWAVDDTSAPGVHTFGITATVDRRAPWMAVLAHCVAYAGIPSLDRDSTLRAGLKCKAAWLLRFTWRANGTSARLRTALAMAMAETDSFLAKRHRLLMARAA